MPNPSDYAQYIDWINGAGFWWKNYQNSNNDFPSLAGLTTYPPETTSWVCREGSSIPHTKPGPSYNYGLAVTYNILRLDINSINDNTYNFELHLTNSDFVPALPTTWGYNGQNLYVRVSPDNFGFTSRYVDNAFYNFSLTGSLSYIFEILSNRFRNVDIYVDGECWSRVSPIVYTWSSVPAISGKNGILSLPTLVDTDGEPISGQSASVFSSLPEGSKVRTLINGAL